MLTKCPNPECGQSYKVKPEYLGQQARCKKCQNVFQVEQHFRDQPLIELPAEEEESAPEQDSSREGKRRSSKEIMRERIQKVSEQVNGLQPSLLAAYKRQENESNTRLLIDMILQRALGYEITDIKAEQRIEGRRADYVLSVKTEDKLVVEVKKIGMPLRGAQIFQASGYAAFAGIPWVVLTNGLVWQLFHISTGEKIASTLVFTIDLKDGLDEEEAEYFYLISKSGISRKNLLDRLWRKMSTLCYDNIVAAILSDEVISKLRALLNKQSGANVRHEDVRSAIENNIFQLS